MFFIWESCCHSNHEFLKSYEPKQEPKPIIYLDANYLYSFAKFLPTDGFKWIDPRAFDHNNYLKSSYKDYVRKVEYPKELREWHNDHSMALDKIEITKEMSKYQLAIAELWNIPIDNVKKLDKEIYVLH